MNRAEDETDEQLFEAALAWHDASLADNMDWDGFVQWLEQSPRHREAYDGVALTEALLHDLAPAVRQEALQAAPLPAPVRVRWLRWGGAMAVAASIALAVFVLRPDETQVYVTGASSQHIALADGSQIDLAPQSRLEVTGDDRMELNGDALFSIRHQPSRTLVVAAGPVEITDIGTQFEVRADKDMARVSVAEGNVSVDVAAMAGRTRLQAGQSLVAERSGNVTIAAMHPDAVGSWTKGQLTYADAPLGLVVRDLARYGGVQVELAPELRALRFSGTLAASDGKAAADDLAGIMGLALHRDGDRLRLERR